MPGNKKDYTIKNISSRSSYVEVHEIQEKNDA